MGLDKEALERYSRQIKLPEIGEKGQAALLGTSVLCVGTGGLGSLSFTTDDGDDLNLALLSAGDVGTISVDGAGDNDLVLDTAGAASQDQNVVE